jgi:guanylate kinase
MNSILETLTKDMKKCFICGKAGSGKDHLKRYLQDQGWKCAIATTTRPPRPGEIHNIDYEFVNVDVFKQGLERKEYIEYSIKNHWFYGTTWKEWRQSKVFIMSPESLCDLIAQDKVPRDQMYIVYLNIPYLIRRERLIQRNDPHDAIQRRLQSDEEDFERVIKDLHPDLIVENPNFDSENIQTLMHQI